MHQVCEFIVVAPTNKGKAVEYAREQLETHLGRAFPHYRFRVEPWGPLCQEDEFTVLPIMNRRPAPGERTDPDELFMCSPIDPRVIPQIEGALRDFDLEGMRAD